MLDSGDSQKDQDKFKSGVIDTIVSMVQGVPGEDRCIILIGYKNEIRTMFQNVNPGLSRRFPIERPFQFANFTVDQLDQILQVKMAEDDLKASEAATLTAREIFTRVLMRPNFTNAGEVNNVLAAAKMNYETRLSRLPLNKRLSDVELEAIDFDPDVDRRDSFELNYEKMVTVLDRRIVDRLIGYHRSYRNVVKRNLDPRKFVPTNFIFKGPSGTLRCCLFILYLTSRREEHDSLGSSSRFVQFHSPFGRMLTADAFLFSQVLGKWQLLDKWANSSTIWDFYRLKKLLSIR